MPGAFLEDFARDKRAAPPTPLADPVVQNQSFEDAYNAGWDDAMAQVEAEQGRVSAQLAERLMNLQRGQKAAVASAISALEPMLHEVFDKLLPRAAERSFLSVLVEDIRELLEDGAGHLVLLVAPEEANAAARLLERAAIDPDAVTVQAEAALGLSQALLRWDGEERRIDMEATLDALDSALERFLASNDQETGDE